MAKEIATDTECITNMSGIVEMAMLHKQPGAQAWFAGAMTENYINASQLAQNLLGIDVMPQLPNTPDGQLIQTSRTSAESLATVGPRHFGAGRESEDPYNYMLVSIQFITFHNFQASGLAKLTHPQGCD